ncbi:hypothetical protein BC629DRAFT_1590889 [Irpex lacteus]|nr:hypothetical protein BC629DRAFT_1590889 [Irpex lacteus]
MSPSDPTAVSASKSLRDMDSSVSGQLRLRCLTTLPNYDASTSTSPSPLILSGVLTLSSFSAVPAPVNQTARTSNSFLGLSNVDSPSQSHVLFSEPVLGSDAREDSFDSEVDVVDKHEADFLDMSRFLPFRELPEDSPAKFLDSFEEGAQEADSKDTYAHPKREYDPLVSSDASSKRPRMEVSSNDAAPSAPSSKGSRI